jgi:hypothetical protein
MSIISLPSINYFSSFKFKGCHILNCRELISDIKFKKKKGDIICGKRTNCNFNTRGQYKCSCWM